MTLYVHRAANLTALHDAVAQLPTPPDPFAPELVVVAQKALAAPLLARMSLKRGIAANIETPTPASFLLQALAAALPDLTAQAFDSRWQPSLLVGAICEALVPLLGTPPFAALARHFQPADDAVDPHTWQLARRIADAFDRYLHHRPELIGAWDAGAEPHDWQAILWRATRAHIDTEPPPAIWEKLAVAITSGAPLPLAWPETIAIYGLHTFRPAELKVIAALGTRVDLHLFTLAWPTPSARTAPFVARHGRLNADVMHWLDGLAVPVDTLVSEPPCEGKATILQSLQQHISGSPVPPSACTVDDSLRIHACHGHLRQVEALRDTLLSLLNADPTLEPRDILVATPDIGLYAPLIDAILAERLPPARPAATAPPTLVTRPTDVPDHRANPLADTLLTAFDLTDSRLVLDDVLALLGRPLVMRTLDLNDDTLRRCRDWFNEAAIRWGRDEHHRRALGQPAVRLHSWRHGFDRLLLGYALNSNDTGEADAWDSIGPVPSVEGSDVPVLGRCIDFLERLFGLFEAMTHPLLLVDWKAHLIDLARLLAGDIADHALLFQDVQASIHEIRNSNHLRLHPGTMRAIVSATFRETRPRPSFQAGGIVVAPLRPMRARKTRIVCLVGLDDGAMARARPAPGFDRLADDRRPGDPDPADDERSAFIEHLMAADQGLHIFYSKYLPGDRTPLDPSLSVLDLVHHAAALIPEEALMSNIFVEHAPHAFLPSSTPAWDPRQHAAIPTAPAARPPLWPANAPIPNATRTRDIPLRFLTDLFCDPQRVILRDIVQATFVRPSDPNPRREPVEPDNLEKFCLAERLTELYLRRIPTDRARTLLQADGHLPWGHAADIVFNHLHRQADGTARAIDDIVERHTTARDGNTPLVFERHRIEIMVGDATIRGSLGGLLPDTARRAVVSGPGPDRELALPPPVRVSWRTGRFRPRDEIRFWIEHLALTVALGEAPTSLFVTKSADRANRLAIHELPPLPRALALRELRAIIETHDTMRAAVAHFHPDCGRAWFLALDHAARSNRGPDLRAAATAWYTPTAWGRNEPAGESLDPAVIALTSAAWTETYPFDHHDFRAVAWRIFEPIAHHLRQHRY